MPTARNVHQRLVAAPAAEVGALLDRLAAADDPVWPAPAWPALRLDRPLAPGADGGHGPIRYAVEEYEPGHRVRFRFRYPGSGYHEFTVEPVDEGSCRVRHTLETDLPGALPLVWPLGLRWLHDALLEDALDAFQYAAGDPPARRARWSPWVRLLRRTLWQRPRAVPPPLDGRLAGDALERVDFVDAWQLPRHPALPAGPDPWSEAVLRPPAFVKALMVVRQGVVGLIGIRRAKGRGPDAFPELARTEEELLLGKDEGHLDFRLAVLTAGDAVTLTTVVTLHNRRGRLYFGVVRRLHPMIIRAMLRRAHRELCLRSTPAARAAGRAAATASVSSGRASS